MEDNSTPTSTDTITRSVPHLRLVPDVIDIDHAHPPKPTVRCSLAALAGFLREHEEWSGVLGWDDFGKRVVFRAPAPALIGAMKGAELNDTLVSRIRLWFEEDLGLEVKKELLLEAIRVVARENTFHPVREYLSSLAWDGQARIAKWLEDYCAVKPTAAEHAGLVRAVATKWLVSCVARAMTPGSKVDTMLILEGRQGIGKSTALQALAGSEFFSDSQIDFGSKDACQTIQGVWIYELSELDVLLRSETSKSKAFLSRSVDRFRIPYGRSPESIPRSVVFCGTVNHGGYLKDRTGNRRFWMVRCEDTINVEGIRDVRDQLWAEATALYARGVEWHLSPEEEALMAHEQEERVEEDPCEERVSEWLGKQGSTAIAVDALLENALGMSGATKNPVITRRVSAILQGLGYRRHKVTVEGRRCWRYLPSAVPPSQCPTADE